MSSSSSSSSVSPPPPQPPSSASTSVSDNQNNDDDWTILDPNTDMSAPGRYGLCISAVVPRPVAVITTVDINGNINCAPYSYTGLVSHDPPLLSHGLCLSRDGTKRKDTLNNIEATGKWIVHILSKSYLEKANHCAETVPPDVDETILAGLDLVLPPPAYNGIPILKDAQVAMECTLWDSREVYNDAGIHTTTIVTGRVTYFHIHHSVLRYKNNDKNRPLVDLEALQAVGRAGDVTYWPVGTTDDTVLAMDRPS